MRKSDSLPRGHVENADVASAAESLLLYADSRFSNPMVAGLAAYAMKRCSMKRKSIDCGIPSLSDSARTGILEAWSRSKSASLECIPASRNPSGTLSVLAEPLPVRFSTVRRQRGQRLATARSCSSDSQSLK